MLVPPEHIPVGRRHAGCFQAWFSEIPFAFFPKLPLKTSAVLGRKFRISGAYCPGGLSVCSTAHLQRYCQKRRLLCRAASPLNQGTSPGPCWACFGWEQHSPLDPMLQTH